MIERFNPPGAAVNFTQAGTRSETVTVLSIALLLRLLVLWDVLVKYPHAWLFTRGMEMGWLAESLLAGRGLAGPFGPPTGPTAFVAPIYPLLVAAVFRVFGSYTQASEAFIILVQIGVNLLSIWLILSIARRLFDRRVALVAALIWSCSLPLIWIPTILWDTSLAIGFVLGLMELALRFRNGASAGKWLLLGAYCGLAALVSPTLVLTLAAVMGWIIWQACRLDMRQWRGVLLAVLSAVVVFSPWPIRNAKVFHAFIPLRTTVGFELWMGNRDGATGFLEESLFPSFNQTELNDYKTRGELGYTNHKTELAKQFIETHPAEFARLTALRVGRFWRGTGAKGGSALYALHAAITSGFGLLGLFFLFRAGRRSTAWLFALPLLVFPLPYYVTHAEFRYRLMIDPLLTMLAAYAMVALYRRYAYQEAADASSELAGATAAHG